MASKTVQFSREIPEEKLQSVQVEKDGQKESQFGVVTINGLKFGVGAGDENVAFGIRGFDFSFVAGEKPKVTVHYNPHQITKKVAETLGLEKLPSYPTYLCYRKDGELIKKLINEEDLD